MNCIVKKTEDGSYIVIPKEKMIAIAARKEMEFTIPAPGNPNIPSR